jgi:hypothetical protein
MEQKAAGAKWHHDLKTDVIGALTDDHPIR